MTRLTWDSRDFESGVSHGVFYPENSPGEVWPGLVSVDDNTPEFDESRTVIDGITVRKGRRSDSFAGSIEVYAYPGGFLDTIAQIRPKRFGFTYRVETAGGYKIHILYNVMAHADSVEYEQDTPSLYKCSISTSPVMLPEGGFSAHMIVDSSIAYPETIADLEDLLYGSELTDSSLPSPIDVFEVFEENSILRVIDNGDGTFTVIGPDEAISMIDSTTFEITWPTVVLIGTDKYKISSL